MSYPISSTLSPSRVRLTEPPQGILRFDQFAARLRAHPHAFIPLVQGSTPLTHHRPSTHAFPPFEHRECLSARLIVERWLRESLADGGLHESRLVAQAVSFSRKIFALWPDVHREVVVEQEGVDAPRELARARYGRRWRRNSAGKAWTREVSESPTRTAWRTRLALRLVVDSAEALPLLRAAQGDERRALN